MEVKPIGILKNKYVVFALCIVLSGVIAFVLVPIGNENLTNTVEIVRVSRQIEKNTIITEDMLQYIAVMPLNLPTNIIKEKQSIVGKVAAVALLPEDNLIPEKFTDTYSITNKEFYDMDTPNKLAVSVSIKSLAASVSGKLLPGDVISVYGFHSEQKNLISYDDLMYLEVLAITNSKAEDLDKRESNMETDTSDAIIPTTITLSVNQNQAEELIELENTGNIHIVFVGRGESSRHLLEQ